jgi:RNA polymerase sigma-70 factor (ECF subfamily)
MIRVATLESFWLMAETSHPGADKRPNQGDAESTLHLLERVRAGDRVALDRLCARYLPRLRRWATGRLPRGARDLIDTDDLVQDTLVRTIHNVDEFEHRREGAFQAYVRQALLNRIRDEARRAQRRPQQAEPANDPAYPGPSPLEEMIGVEAVERYEAALKRLRDQEREAIVARIEMGLSYDEVAAALKRPSADAARMLVGRALLRLAKEMRRES